MVRPTRATKSATTSITAPPSDSPLSSQVASGSNRRGSVEGDDDEGGDGDVTIRAITTNVRKPSQRQESSVEGEGSNERAGAGSKRKAKRNNAQDMDQVELETESTPKTSIDGRISVRSKVKAKRIDAVVAKKPAHWALLPVSDACHECAFWGYDCYVSTAGKRKACAGCEGELCTFSDTKTILVGGHLLRQAIDSTLSLSTSTSNLSTHDRDTLLSVSNDLETFWSSNIGHRSSIPPDRKAVRTRSLSVASSEPESDGQGSDSQDE